MDIKAILDSVPPPTTAGRKRNISTKEKAIRGAKRIEKQAKEKLEIITKREAAKKVAPQRQLRDVKSIVKAIEGDATSVVEIDSLVSVPPTVQKYAEENVIFSPNPGPQTDFLAASEREVFYGGARGGGKSYSLLVDPLRYCGNSNHSALILRRTMPELRDLIMHSNRLYPKAYPGAKWREQEKEWRFPSGAKIEFGYAENRQDALRYQGRAYNWIGIDELPQFPDEGILNDLRGSLRSVDLSLPEFIRATGNPGNVGSAWVKELFINPATANTRFAAAVDTPKGKREITRRYIPAKLQDNPYLTQSDSYLIMLSSLPEIQRRQWLDGDWDIWDGAAFPEFRKEIHVIEPFPIPKSWIKFRAADWGYSSPACVLWFAVDWDGNLYVYRELYVKLMTADIFAQRITELERDDGPIQYGVLDSSVWSKRGDVGPSIVDTMRTNGVIWRPSDRSANSRHAGKQELHRRLALHQDTQKPTIHFFKNCKNVIRDLPTLPLDPNDPEDVDTKSPNDHSYDACRYGVMSRPMNPYKASWINRLQEEERYKPSDSEFGY